MSDDPFYLRFGIPSLDRLITGHADGTRAPDKLPTGIILGKEGSKSITIIGPDGTGKSVLGLHLASRYAADCWERGQATPFVLYVSTDLNFEAAYERVWKAFCLNQPGMRTVPFARLPSYAHRDHKPVGLREIDPLGNMSKFLLSNQESTSHGAAELQVGFVDLARNTAGDDWGFAIRMLALLPQPKSGDPKHLIIVDAVEGFETLVGGKDAFGEHASRRSRIAQLMRLAAAGSAKCHLALIIEETFREERIPEVFITDFVIRLRDVEAGGYVRRTVQVEKARGYPHVRGQHPFVIRSGKGSTTGKQQNYDDPRIPEAGPSQAYFHVFRSVNYLSRTTMQTQGDPRPEPPQGAYAAFGIEYLDDMLACEGRPLRRNKEERTDSGGLPCASVTALIGDSETQKTRLGRAFLARCFAGYPSRLERQIQACRPQRDRVVPEMGYQNYVDSVRNLVAAKEGGQATWNQGDQDVKPALLAGWELCRACSEEGVPILLSSQDIDNHGLSRDFSRLLFTGRLAVRRRPMAAACRLAQSE